VQLVSGLGRLDLRKELGALAARLEAARDLPGRGKALVDAYLWLGEPERALATAREAVVAGDEGELYSLQLAYAASGQFEEAERVSRRMLAASGGKLTLVVPIAQALAGQGRIADALRELDRLRGVSSSDLPGSEGTKLAALHFLRASLLAALGDRGAVLREARLTHGMPTLQGVPAVALLLLGDAVGAQSLAASIPETEVDRDEIAALATWRRGDCDAARAELAALEERELWPLLGYAPSYLVAEVSSACGDPRETLTAVERFHRIPPRGAWRPAAFDRSLILAARARLALGDRVGARRDLDRLLGILAHADADLPLLREARQLRQQL
jgi:hypothetical protein